MPSRTNLLANISRSLAGTHQPNWTNESNRIYWKQKFTPVSLWLGGRICGRVLGQLVLEFARVQKLHYHDEFEVLHFVKNQTLHVT